MNSEKGSFSFLPNSFGIVSGETFILSAICVLELNLSMFRSIYAFRFQISISRYFPPCIDSLKRVLYILLSFLLETIVRIFC